MKMTTSRKVIKGLTILARYGGMDAYDVYVEHDVIFSHDIPPDRIRLEDVVELTRLGWRYGDPIGGVGDHWHCNT